MVPGRRKGSVMLEKFTEAVFKYCFAILDGCSALLERTDAVVGLACHCSSWQRCIFSCRAGWKQGFGHSYSDLQRSQPSP